MPSRCSRGSRRLSCAEVPGPGGRLAPAAFVRLTRPSPTGTSATGGTRRGSNSARYACSVTSRVRGLLRGRQADGAEGPARRVRGRGIRGGVRGLSRGFDRAAPPRRPAARAFPLAHRVPRGVRARASIDPRADHRPRATTPAPPRMRSPALAADAAERSRLRRHRGQPAVRGEEHGGCGEPRPAIPTGSRQMHPESHGNADLVAHFFRRGVHPGSTTAAHSASSPPTPSPRATPAPPVCGGSARTAAASTRPGAGSGGPDRRRLW